MGKRTTVYEDKEEKERRRREKAQARMDRHKVKCPHCGADALDHMTKCPKCGGELKPLGYVPMDEKKRKLIKGICYGIGIAVAIAIVVVIFVTR